MIRRCAECETPAVMIVYEDDEPEAKRLGYCAEHGDELVREHSDIVSHRMIPANSPLDVPDDRILNMAEPRRYTTRRSRRAHT